MNQDLEQIYSQMSEIEKQNFTRLCHEKLLLQKFNGQDNASVEIATKQKNKINFIKLSGQQLKQLNRIYLKEYATKEEKQSYTQYCRQLALCYQIVFSKKTTNTKQSQEYTNDGINYSRDKIKKMARKYCFLLKNMNEETYIEQFQIISKYNSILEKIMSFSLDEPNDIIALLQTYEKKYVALIRGKIGDYIIHQYHDLPVEQKLEMETALKARFNIYTKYCQKQNKAKIEEERKKRELKLLPEARKIVQDYINSSLTRKEFEQTYHSLCSPIEIVKKYDPATYNQYKQKKASNQKQKFNENINLAHTLLYYLKNGINIGNGITRPLDFLDYYLIIGVSPQTLTESIQYDHSEISKTDYMLLRKFISTIGVEQTPLNVEHTLASRLEVNAQRNEKGFPIPGTGRIITTEEKQDVINFLLLNNIPLTQKLYDIALKRYINSLSNNKENSNKQNISQLIKTFNKN